LTIEFTNVKSFERSLNDFVEKTKAAPGEVATRIAFQAFGAKIAGPFGLTTFAGVVDRTPVDTGWARGSWNIAEGAPDLSIPPKPEKGTILAAPRASPPLNPPEFPVWWVTNNLKYIGELEAGRSKQMDKGFMVQRTLVALEAEINQTLRNLDL